MASAGRRKRRVRVDESLITDFLDLRDSSIVQTGPKRPRGRGVVPLTPAEPTPLRQRRDTSSDTKEQPLAETVRDLIESAAEVSALTPGLPTRAILTPIPARTPRRSPRLAALVETPAEDVPTLRSALKGIRSLSKLRKSGREADSRVSFGEYVTVTEYSPEYREAGEGLSVTSGEEAEDLGAGNVVLEPLEEGEGSSEEGEGGEIEGGVSEEEEGGGEFEGGISEEEEGGGGEIEGGISEEEEGGGGEIEGGSEEEEEEDGPRLKTPHAASQKAGRSPQLTTPRYSDFRPVRKSKPSPVRRTAPKGRSGKQQKVVKTLPRLLIKNLFTLFCKRRVTKDAMDLILKFTEVYLKHASEDLAVFARHAGRRTIEVEDVILLLRRQRHISESQGFEYLVNTYLPLEYIEELLPCAVAGKRIVPSMKS